MEVQDDNAAGGKLTKSGLPDDKAEKEQQRVLNADADEIKVKVKGEHGGHHKNHEEKWRILGF